MDFTIGTKRPPAYHCPVHGDQPTRFCCAGKHASAEARRIEQAVAKRKHQLAEMHRRTR
jgi:hypothetical protein